ncbi:sodium:solute symporter family protein [Chlamydia sp. 17-3921]|uniref:sodium:solute symporter family protein n=1 Tax=Chlamydia sp. 17-3921 TaxID=2675798 RepID=UPI00191968F2|nr:sodium:solute symporter family protein [Chlamydia sp. 17-3921]
MNFSLFLFCLLGIQAFCLYIGRKGCSGIRDRESYFLAGRSLKTFPLMMTFIATQIGGGVLLGAAEEAFCYGYGVVLYPLGVALGLIFLGIGPGRKLASGSLVTVIAIFQEVYGSKTLRKIAFILSALSLFFILVAQVVALDKLFGAFPYGKVFATLFWIILGCYTSTGGFRGVVRTDVIQALFLLAAVIACGYAVWSCAPQVIEVVQKFQPLSFAKLSSWVFMPMLFMLIEQDMVQRCVAASSPKNLQIAAISAGCVILAFNFIPLFLGTLGAKAGILGSCPLIDTVTYFCGPSFAAIMAAAVGVAILSTADSLISALAQLISEEIPMMRVAHYRYLVLGLAAAAPLVAIGFTNIVDVLILSYSLSVCCLSVPIGFSLLFHYQPSSASGWAAVLSGGISYALTCYFSIRNFGDLFSWLCSLFAFLCVESLCIFWIRYQQKQERDFISHKE